MLKNIHVKNFALIDEVEIDLGPKLNILTGETGAGKSIIIDAVNFALGQRVSKDIVRDDTEYALSELVFGIEDGLDGEEVRSVLDSYDIPYDDDELIFTRKIVNGKSSARINGETVTATTLKAVASVLLDIHGQHDNQSLLSKNSQHSLLDRLLEEELSDLPCKIKDNYVNYKAKKSELDDCKNTENEKELAYLKFQLEEIDSANLKPGEDDENESLYKKMSSAKKIAEAVSMAHRMTGYDSDGAGSNIGRALQVIRQVSDLDDGCKDLELILTDIDGLINDFNRSVADYEASLDFSDEDFYEVESRINTINSLKSKYGQNIDLILSRRDELEAEIEKLLNFDEYVEKLSAEVELARKNLLELCKKVSNIRINGAKKLSAQIEEALRDLNFLDANFEIRVTPDEDNISSSGIDSVEFFVSTNPGEKVKPLANVASGGEMSRIMLAIKSIMASKDRINTLIFDEIDTGISGRTAQKVSEKMSKIAGNHQVIVVTHLPQIAAMADNHYEIKKATDNGRTNTYITKLSEEEMITELARMLGGVTITDAVIENAKDMKTQANNTKREL